MQSQPLDARESMDRALCACKPAAWYDCLLGAQVKPGREWTDVLLRGDMVAWLVDLLPSLSAAHSPEAAASPLAVSARMLLERLAGLAGDVFPKPQPGAVCAARSGSR